VSIDKGLIIEKLGERISHGCFGGRGRGRMGGMMMMLLLWSQGRCKSQVGRVAYCCTLSSHCPPALGEDPRENPGHVSGVNPGRGGRLLFIRGPPGLSLCLPYGVVSRHLTHSRAPLYRPPPSSSKISASYRLPRLGTTAIPPSHDSKIHKKHLFSMMMMEVIILILLG
jgi:hypothetical protein